MNNKRGCIASDRHTVSTVCCKRQHVAPEKCLRRIPRIADIFPVRKDVGWRDASLLPPFLSRWLNRPWRTTPPPLQTSFLAARPPALAGKLRCALYGAGLARRGLEVPLGSPFCPFGAHASLGGNGFEFAQFKAISSSCSSERRRSRGRFLGLNAESEERRMKGVTRRKLSIF